MQLFIGNSHNDHIFTLIHVWIKIEIQIVVDSFKSFKIEQYEFTKIKYERIFKMDEEIKILNNEKGCITNMQNTTKST